MSKVVLEIGANNGDSTLALYELYKLPVFACEPVPYLLNTLRERFKRIPEITILGTAVDEKFAIRQFNIAGQHDWGCGSLHQFNPKIKELWSGRDDFKMTDSVNVLCITGKQLVEISQATSVEYLWIDAQGNDFSVLKSFRESLSIVKAGKCEASLNVRLYDGCNNDSNQIREFLHQQGFETNVSPDDLNKECDVHFKRKS